MFDPYHKWLGIPPTEQPPDHYRLLGLARFEADREVIDAAANRQMAYLQTCATGDRVALSQRLLNEIAAARICLLTASRKVAYDDQLLKKSSPKLPPVSKPAPVATDRPIPLPRKRVQQSKPMPLVQVDEARDNQQTSTRSAPDARAFRGQSRARDLRILAAISLALVLLGVLALLWNSLRSRPSSPPAATEVVIENPAVESAGSPEPVIAVAETARTQDRAWTPLFDGKTLEGWHGDSRFWWVSDGAIEGRCDSPEAGGSFLIHDKPWEDFELRLKFKLNRGNSGVQIRSEERPDFRVNGPQVDLIYSHFAWMGCLVGEGLPQAKIAMTSESVQDSLRTAIRQDDWNEMGITVAGPAVKVVINGVVSVDANVPSIAKSGVIALQLHSVNPTHILFKEVEIRQPAKDGPGDHPANEKLAQKNPETAKSWIPPRMPAIPEIAFRSLFGGRTIDGPLVNMSNCWLEEQYGDFALRFQYRLRQHADQPWSGVRLRHGGGRRLSVVISEGICGGLLLDQSLPDLRPPLVERRLDEMHRIVLPFRDLNGTYGSWNDCDVFCQGPRTIVAINGVVVNEITNGPTGKGMICLAGYEGSVNFRAVRVANLDDTQSASTAATAAGPSATDPTKPVVLQWRANDWAGSPVDYASYSNGTARVGMGARDFGFGEVGFEATGLTRVEVEIDEAGTFRHFDENTSAGFMIDYHTPGGGYTKRQFCGFSIGNRVNRRSIPNPSWGKGSKPDQVEMLRLAKSLNLDLARWAPPGWDGKVWFTLLLQNTGKNTWVKAKLRPVK